MSQTRAATRYATALLGAAVERNELDAVTNDVEALGKMISASPDLAAFLRSPVVSKEKKKKALRELLSGRTGETVLLFVLLLASRGREPLLEEVLRQFRRLRDERLGILDVTARSATEFTPEQKAKLAGQIGDVTGKQVRLTVERDPSLIGGFTVQYEDTVWDASVRRQLELLRGRLAGAA